jgi:nucleoside-diphosphate-sugar epimerase
MSTFAVIGGRGFIGGHLVRHLESLGHTCQVPERGEWPAEPAHVVYAAGLTGDFRQKPFETVRAHVSDLATQLEDRDFDSFLYLSSTRVYAGQSRTVEDTLVLVNPLNPEHLYNLSKLMGESVCLSTGRPNVRVARLSNVYGPELASPMFLDHIVRDSVDAGRISVKARRESAKDYIHVDDAVTLLGRISLGGKHSIYNVASGVNVSNQSLLDRLRAITGCIVEFQQSEDMFTYPSINTDRIRGEFGIEPRALLEELPRLVESYKQKRRAA